MQRCPATAERRESSSRRSRTLQAGVDAQGLVTLKPWVGMSRAVRGAGHANMNPAQRRRHQQQVRDRIHREVNNGPATEEERLDRKVLPSIGDYLDKKNYGPQISMEEYLHLEGRVGRGRRPSGTGKCVVCGEKIDHYMAPQALYCDDHSRRDINPPPEHIPKPKCVKCNRYMNPDLDEEEHICHLCVEVILRSLKLRG